MTISFDESGPAWAPGYRHVSHAVAPIEFGFREVPEDFEVEELPLYEATGEGEHLILEIEKRRVSSEEAVRTLAHALERPLTAFGYAGRKDVHAIARQRVSVEGVEPERVEGLVLRGLKVLSATRHPHKLRVGQLAGNRFRLRLRGVDDAGAERAERVLRLLAETGLPNFYGVQRFGRGGRTHELGALLLAGDAEAYVRALVAPEHAGSGPAQDELREAVAGGTRRPQKRLGSIASSLDATLAAVARQLARRPCDWGWAVRAVPKTAKRFQINALQSHLFNRILGVRMTWEGGLTRVLAGDVAHIHASGGAFLVEDVAVEQPRASAFKISASGPMLGHRMLRAEGEPGALEAAAAELLGVEGSSFRGLKGGLDQRGTRRPLRVPLVDVSLERDGANLLVGFRLPPGSYATTVVEELRKEYRPSE